MRAPRECTTLAARLLAACSLLASAGCDPGTTECSCRATGLEVDVCPALSGMVQSIVLTGSACMASKAVLVPDASVDGGGAAYDIQPTQPGQCSVAVSFTNGLSFAAYAQPSPLTISRGPGCCSGLYPDPPSADTIQACAVPEAGADAAPGDAETLPDAPPDT